MVSWDAGKLFFSFTQKKKQQTRQLLLQRSDVWLSVGRERERERERGRERERAGRAEENKMSDRKGNCGWPTSNGGEESKASG